jgi:hypothetical protein
MNRAIAMTALVVGAGWATTAWADSPRLKGAYAFTGTAVCLTSPAGFDSKNRPSDFATPNGGGGSFTRSFSVEGVRTFDGNGNGTVKGTAVSIVGHPSVPGVAPNASSADFSFNFTYVVNDDRTWVGTSVPTSFQETITSGPRAGQTVTMLDGGIPPVTGIISVDGKTLTAAHLAPQLETRVFSNGDVSPEICHRSRVLIKLQDSDGDDGNGNGH